jgi:class 3 adenylate cyclase
MLRGYLRLRGRPRPERVSTRRIRTLELYSLAMGLVWATISVLMMSQADSTTGGLLLWVLYVMCFGGVVMMSTIPVAVIAYAGPLAVANMVGAMVFDVYGFWFLLFLCSGGMISMVRATWDNWHRTKANVRLRIDSVEAEAARSRMMERISSQLGKYMSPQLYQSIFSGEEKGEIASKRKKLTICFSDIASFTEITDQLESEELTALLNRYLTEMSTIALAHGATIDKFIGDAIVVYFGDPQTRGVKEDADQCVRMAIAMQDRVRELGAEWISMGLERTFELRIGINTGYCTVGNFGSEDRMDHTIIGSEVNLAARLESVADVGGILLANETHSLVTDWVGAEEGVPVTVKGFARPVKTFRVKGIKDVGIGGTARIRHEIDGLSLTLNLDQLNDEGRKQAVLALKDVLLKLEDPDVAE